MIRSIIISTILFVSTLFGQTFTKFIESVGSAPIELRQKIVDKYLKNNNYAPIIEDTLAYFIFQSDGSNPYVAGDFTGWDSNIAAMKNIGGTNLWYLAKSFETNARLDYQFVYNDSIWTLDPLNPNKVLGGFGYNSELRMPGYKPPKEIQYNQNYFHGVLIDTLWFSSSLNNSREITVYLPPNYSKTFDNYPLVLVNDGSDYLSFAKMDKVLDYLINERSIEPIIVVFVPPVDRNDEYLDDKEIQYTEMIINELIPWLENEFRISRDSKDRLIMGSSLGGNIALWIALQNPEIFGKIGVFSPFVENDILYQIYANNVSNQEIFILHGTYDHIDLIHSSVQKLYTLLKQKNFNFIYKEFPESHSYGFWRGHIDDMLNIFFPKGT